MVGTRKAKTWKSMKNGYFLKCIQYKTCTQMCRNHTFLDEAGWVLNEKMMTDLTVIVPELEINRKVSNIDVSTEKCPSPGLRVLTGAGEGRAVVPKMKTNPLTMSQE
jgi:hypothetical protein